MAKTLDPHRIEQDARVLFMELDAQVPVAYDDTGRRIEITASARLIAISDALAQAVVVLLVELGVNVVVDHVRIDPATGDEQVIAICGRVAAQDAVVPIHPGALRLRAYPATGDILLAGQPLTEAIVPDTARSADGWVPASAIVAASARTWVPDHRPRRSLGGGSPSSSSGSVSRS